MEKPQAETSAHNSVLAALAWFDVFSYPLTAVEAARYSSLFGVAASVEGALEMLTDSAAVAEQDGYYYIAGQASSVPLRQQRFRLAGRKLKRAQMAGRVFGLLPSVRLVALCNSLAVANAEDDSDIDFFVVCRPRTLWLTRLMLAGSLKLFGLRPEPGNQKDKLCLSFFVSENALDMSRLQHGSDDPYMRFWVDTVAPLYDAGDFFSQFRQANTWINAHSTNIRRKKGILGTYGRSGRFERLAKEIQLRRFPAPIRQMANTDSRVLISNDILKFHVNDRRELYRNQFTQRLQAMGL